MPDGRLSYAQIEGVWLKAAAGTKYATRQWAALMAAIALAESGGRPGAVNPTDDNGKQTSWGLWQISNGTHSSVSPHWNNPYVNAKLAVHDLSSKGLTAWGTYDDGAYKAYLSGRTTPDTAGLPSDAAEGSESLAAAGIDAQAADCLIGFSGFNLQKTLTIIPGVYHQTIGAPGVGNFCLLSRSGARGIVGLVLLSAGTGTILIGLLLLGRLTGVQEAAGVLRDIRGGGGGGAAGQAGSAAAGAASAAPEGTAAGEAAALA